MKHIVVLGTGYVGLPLALVLARSGFKVTAVDINKNVVKAINSGILHINEKELKSIMSEPEVRKNIIAKEEPTQGDVFIIAVPTPLDKKRKVADLSFVTSALESITAFLKKGDLIIIESTIPPLTCRDFVTPLVEKRSELKVGKDLMLAHCPERILPGNIFHELVHNDRVIGGVDKKSSDAARDIYKTFVKGEIYTTDDITAECCKLMENTYRDVNIALANEFAEVLEKLGVDVSNAIEIANKHPRVDILNPGIGVGGHCIPIDPWFMRQVDPENTNLVLTARKINDGVPKKIAAKVRKKLSKLKNPKIIALGLTYKANTYDLRESPALEIVKILAEEGYDIKAYDKLADGYEYKDMLDIVKGIDCLLVLVKHDYIKEEIKANKKKIKEMMRTPIIMDFENKR